jgi:hypothetical protein
MALAMIYPEPDKRGRGNKGKAEETSDFSQKRLSQARAVLRHSEALAQNVLAHRISLDKALEIVADEQRDTQSSDAMMVDLRLEAPDLADLVDEERLNVAEAYSALEERRLKAAKLEASKRETLLRLSQEAWNSVTSWASDDFIADLTERFTDPEFARQWMMRVRPDADRIPEIMRGADAMGRFFALVSGEHANV